MSPLQSNKGVRLDTEQTLACVKAQARTLHKHWYKPLLQGPNAASLHGPPEQLEKEDTKVNWGFKRCHLKTVSGWVIHHEYRSSFAVWPLGFLHYSFIMQFVYIHMYISPYGSHVLHANPLHLNNAHLVHACDSVCHSWESQHKIRCHDDLGSIKARDGTALLLTPLPTVTQPG